MRRLCFAFLAVCQFLLVPVCLAEIRVITGHSATGSNFSFPSIPPPSTNDVATSGLWTLIDGNRDPNGGRLGVLQDGRVPSQEDEPSANFFFRPGTDGGRVLLDLGRDVSVKQIASYSWHTNTRAAQVYTVYGTSGRHDIPIEIKRGTDPATRGWKRIANVDTRKKDSEQGGQHGVALIDSTGLIGDFRFLLFDISPTESRDPFGNTFYSEIDVIDAYGPPLVASASLETRQIRKSFETEGGKFHFTVDVTRAPDLSEWCDDKLQPVVKAWYPKIVEMLPSENFTAPTNVGLVFRTDMPSGVPAYAIGGGIHLNVAWFRSERDREALGAVVHELVHVVQSYHRARRRNSNTTPTPGWVVEGIADYIRWFLYEPQSKGAEITARNSAAASYDSSYRITGNFLNWVTDTYDKEVIRKLNASAREGKYSEELWKEWTGKTLPELGKEWKKFHEDRLAK